MIICRYLNDINSSTGLLSPLNHPLLSVFPNPAGSSEEIRISGLIDGDYLLSCYDVNGREIVADDISAVKNSCTISTHGWPGGLYILRLVDRNTSTLRIARLVIQ